MKKLVFFLCLSLLCLILGCATNRPTPEQLASADYGDYPANYEELVKGVMSQLLKDPYSAVYAAWKGPIKGYRYDNGKFVFGYKVCAYVNAKNVYGGFTGAKGYFFLIKDNHVLGYATPRNGSEYMCDDSWY